MKQAKTFANLVCVLAAGVAFGPISQAQIGGGGAKPPLHLQHKQSPLHATALAHAKLAKADAAPVDPGPAKAEPVPGHRDPFTALITERKPVTGNEHLPPGKAGLVVGTVRVDGTVQSGNDLIAVVSNPDQHVYFVRQGDRLYDGDVEKISSDGVTFREESKDAFGKPVDRMVTKRIYSSAGEQQ